MPTSNRSSISAKSALSAIQNRTPVTPRLWLTTSTLSAPVYARTFPTKSSSCRAISSCVGLSAANVMDHSWSPR
ncbi:hypothetical protein [Natronomonas salina]|uniref:hypothetical protein n=1 Tax=Natronomonas salina TaxID=1710540 RepID=UPI001FE4D952|nr:hypothetical protein [Natronomonas salina]